MSNKKPQGGEENNRCHRNIVTRYLERKESVLPLAFRQDSIFPQAKSSQFYRAIIYPGSKDLKKVAPFSISRLRLLLNRSLPQVFLNIGHRINDNIMIVFICCISAKY